MIVTKLDTSKFAKHGTVSVELPRKGLVLVTGDNGEGKSTIAEAVSQGVWNKSIRSKPGWRVDDTSGVRIEFEGGYVRRLVGKSKHKLEWRVGDHGAGEWPTRTKSQTELESHVGSHHVWRHACVFHTKDASVFTEASDAERKRLLEEVLELGRVEGAYRDAMKEVSALKVELAKNERTQEVAETKLAGLEEQKALLTGELEDVPDIDALRTRSRELKVEYDAALEASQAAQDEHSALNDAMIAAQVNATRAAAQLERFQTLGGVCAACDQEVDPAHRAKHEDAAQALVTAAKEKTAECLTVAKKAAVRAAEASTTAREAQAAYQEVVTAGREAVAAQKRNEATSTKADGIDESIAEAGTLAYEARVCTDASRLQLFEVQAAAQVLSYKGARAGMLAGAVASLTTLANDWLSRLGKPGLSVSFGSQSKNKKDVISDKISFELHGAGGGLGYGAASTGEQRRVDIALLLALGELAAESRGMSPDSTMFVDELFDGLDAEGVAAVVVLLRELSAERCVVVITHSKQLVTALAPDLHLEARNGTISGKQ